MSFFRPKAASLLRDIASLMKRYEDDIFYGKGKLEMIDEIKQSGASEMMRSSSFYSKAEYGVVRPSIQVC